MPRIIAQRRLVPNLHLIEVEAPDTARAAKPGQFVILMPDARGERIPLSIADWNAARGTVTSVFLVLGTATRKLALLKSNDEIPVFVGPLGRPTEIANFGTVVLAAGCYGIGALWPTARALRRAGNRVITVLDAKASYLVYWDDRYRRVSERLIVSSRDPGIGGGEYVAEKIKALVAAEKIDRVMAVGCTAFMRSVSEATRPAGIKTIVSLNPIMVDGTGMCGACRCTAAGKTKFACVDGPDFDGHEVDWDELFLRRKSYFDEEIQALCRWEKENLP
ncbi:MAG TPA: sulfide/dihydroorotate dehydrogenase-like FAD/NAD-binding protein [Candidatus Aminicenantes bacterium]|nr:sulfide/dihydroorotate dehydrogenase-like FAD/NAD-binding protein [Acidobacteriota bacterium]HNQ81060.1 sulfide/dihydroorotate dehydrogenase-like FAD/NAD-binding protein [Candidatus Aminicenantes bacterium]MDD8039862.1 sulfide/dihydroorotate dehydrogenase-like FAD/NAD-binding protein [Acidobacteriota bacterium]MDW3227185.1 sulfide/dihydroorotate dehydrogenase-like FAD/NAD-binding protein [Acidobacteriota bacterium]HOF83843.1 sulfide/dihydroorotate dehydrogenase-like FAD/NAD-binding protein [